ncbi:MAG TPA: hypothetical protein VGQ53_14135 [Chitinophagaceae bacterium]|jgi:hypothetical protein|nr:hypothetical protein [Chitinophagaceae bacterium]
MDSSKLISVGRTTAKVSFFGGALIFLLFYLSNSGEFGLLGVLYAACMFIINLVIVALIVFKANREKTSRKHLFRTVGVMLLNIPIFIFYCWFAIILMNTVRVTFVNSTTDDLVNIKINGCQGRNIDKLKVGQSKTLWIHIPNDCGISIAYKLKGNIVSEDITGYVSSDGGYIMTFYIGTHQKPYDHDL